MDGSKFCLLPNIIDIQDGVCLCAFSVVGPGVTCSSHSVLTLGSVASKNLDSYFIYSGCPARKTTLRVIS